MSIGFAVAFVRDPSKLPIKPDGQDPKDPGDPGDPPGTGSGNSNGWTPSEKASATRAQLNAASILDYSTPTIDSLYNNLVNNTLLDPISPVTPSGNDGVWTISDIPDVNQVKIVVKKPSLSGGTYNITNIPASPTAAWTHIKDALEAVTDANAANPGTYGRVTFPENATIELTHAVTPTGAHLVLEDINDLEIDFRGSTLVMPNQGAGIVMSNCQVMSLKNYTIYQTLITAVSADVVADSGSPTGYKFVVDNEFIAPIESLYGSSVPLKTAVLAQDVNGKTRIKADGTQDTFMNRGNSTDNWKYQAGGTIVATAPYSHSSAPYQAGDRAIIQLQNNVAQTVVHKNDEGDVEDITHENATILNGAGMGWVNEVNRGIHLINCKTGPHPDVATSLIGTISDTFHMNSNGGDIVIEDCHFETGMDDMFTAKGNWWRVVEIDGNDVIVDTAGSRDYNVNIWAGVGDKIIGLDENTMLVQGSVTAQVKSTDNNSGKQHRITLSSMPSWVTVGQLVANVSRGSGRILIRDSWFGYTRAQGNLIQASYVKIENNHFDNIAGPGIEVNFALKEWYECVMAGHIFIKNNTFHNCGVGASKVPYAIAIHGEDGSGNQVNILRNVSLIGNTFSTGNVTGGGNDEIPSLGPLSVFPGVKGWGTESTETIGAQLYRVTNLNDTGAGSLRAGLENTSALNIVFDVAGRIVLRNEIDVKGKKTVFGQSAPGKGICISMHEDPIKSSLKIASSHVAFQHIHFRIGASRPRNGAKDNNKNNVKVLGDVVNVVFDHCTFGQSTDQQALVYEWPKMVTFSHCIFGLGLHRSVHSENLDGNGDPVFQAHSMSMQIDSDSNPVGERMSRITLYRNLFIHNNQRSPWIGADLADVTNNVVLRHGNFGMEISIRHGNRRMNIIKNLVLDSTPSGLLPASIKYSTGNGEIYPEGNIGASRDANDDETDFFGIGTSMTTGNESFWTGSRHNMGYTLDEIDANETLVDTIIAEVGAFPWNRDAIDAQCMVDLKARGGGLRDCFGGDQVTPQNNNCELDIAIPSYTGGPSKLGPGVDGIPDAYKDQYGLPRTTNGMTYLASDGRTLFQHFMHTLTVHS